MDSVCRIQNKMQCPICFELMTQETAMCKSGHTFCKMCAARVRRCPSCEEKIKMSARNLLLEEIVKKFMENPDEFIKVFN